MWDWYFIDAVAAGLDTENESGITFRVTDEDPELFYLMDTWGEPKTSLIFLLRQGGGWGEVGKQTERALKEEIWYTAYLIVEGDTFTFTMKERKDATPFQKIKPIATGKDGTIKKGRIGTYSVSYWDNVVVGSIGTGPEELQQAFAVEPTSMVKPTDKLVSTWAAIKSSN